MPAERTQYCGELCTEALATACNMPSGGGDPCVTNYIEPFGCSNRLPTFYGHRRQIPVSTSPYAQPVESVHILTLVSDLH